MRTYFLFLALSVVFLPALACAQGASPLVAKSLDQYPSFIEINGTADGVSPGSIFGLRCGITYNSGHYALNGFTDISFMNEKTNEYARYQNIFGKYTVTGFSPNGGGKRMNIEIIEPDGSMRAKDCEGDINTDAFSDCRPITAFASAAQVQRFIQIAEQSCDAAIIQKAADLNKLPAPNPQETQDFQQKLERRVMILEN